MPILLAIVTIDLIGFGILLPLLPFMAPLLGATNTDIAMIFVIYSVFAGLCGPFWGRMSDKFGRKPIILICLSGICLGNIMLAYSTELWMVFVARAFAGVMSGNFGVASAMVADMSTPENRAKSMGILSAGFGIGMTLGPVLGGFLAGDEVNYKLPALTAAAMSFIAVIAGAIMLKETLTPEKRAENQVHTDAAPKQSLYATIKQSGNLHLVSLYLLQNTNITLAGFIFPLWVGSNLGWSPKDVGYVFMAQGVCTAIIQFKMIGPLTAKLGEVRLLLMGITGLTVGYGIGVFAFDTATILLCFFAIIIGSTFCTPMLNTLIANRTPNHLRGQIMGTTSSMSAWGRVVGPAVGGLIMFTTADNYAIAWAAGILIGLAYAVWPIRELQKAKQESLAEQP